MKLFEIPDIDLSNVYSFFSKMFSIFSKMFSTNNTFHVSNNNGKLFELKEGKPVETVQLKSVYFMNSFANDTIVWRPKAKWNN